ncbi:riboflavin synthase alpha chain [Cenarchaeum symbiosum A]|uniref:Riboflavin synthase n=1 Tax=Cenarchaeum symbiosum (strain A) TaxID=414004 RepID=A0RYE8_CENSY|nr:riboflavin synthase alpha chain [Cenarchaeum symbiosum A]
MFTGIIEGTGRVAGVARPARRSALRMTVDLGPYAKGLKQGQSVALNGVCLTVTERTGVKCHFEIIDETARRTDLGSLRRGSIVNIERSLRAGGSLDGHFVLGHIDGVGTIRSIQEKKGEIVMQVEIPSPLAKQVVEKGSIAIDGISLTVTKIRKNRVTISLIPHTIEMTNLGSRHTGDRVNIETDILAKYAARKP